MAAPLSRGPRVRRGSHTLPHEHDPAAGCAYAPAASAGTSNGATPTRRRRDILTTEATNREMAERYNLVVIGSGPAGQKAAIQAAKLGKRVAIVDRRQMLGGVCVHTGTIPSKTMREAILYLSGFRQRAFYGKSYSVKADITVKDLAFRVGSVLRREIEVVRDQLQRNGIQVVEGSASFTGPNGLAVEGPERIRRPRGGPLRDRLRHATGPSRQHLLRWRPHRRLGPAALGAGDLPQRHRGGRGRHRHRVRVDALCAGRRGDDRRRASADARVRRQRDHRSALVSHAPQRRRLPPRRDGRVRRSSTIETGSWPTSRAGSA